MRFVMMLKTSLIRINNLLSLSKIYFFNFGVSNFTLYIQFVVTWLKLGHVPLIARQDFWINRFFSGGGENSLYCFCSRTEPRTRNSLG